MSRIIGMQTSVITNERKYHFTIPFCLLRAQEVSVWMVEVTFGVALSSRMRFSMVRAVLKLVFSVFQGNSRCQCMIVGK